MDVNAIFPVSFALFLLMDPVGNIPIYLAVLKNIEPKKQKKIIIRELFIALAIIILFTFLGEHLLNLLHIGQETTLISGGIILFIIALKMIFPTGNGYGTEGPGQGDPFVVPLAVPLVAGPSVLATVMIYAHQETMVTLLSSIIIAWAASLVILILSPFLKRLLGDKIITACERLMGLLLTLMGVQMFLEGLKGCFGH